MAVSKKLKPIRKSSDKKKPKTRMTLPEFLDNLPVRPCGAVPGEEFCSICDKINHDVAMICPVFAKAPGRKEEREIEKEIEGFSLVETVVGRPVSRPPGEVVPIDIVPIEEPAVGVIEVVEEEPEIEGIPEEAGEEPSFEEEEAPFGEEAEEEPSFDEEDVEWGDDWGEVEEFDAEESGEPQEEPAEAPEGPGEEAPEAPETAPVETEKVEIPPAEPPEPAQEEPIPPPPQPPVPEAGEPYVKEPEPIDEGVEPERPEEPETPSELPAEEKEIPSELLPQEKETRPGEAEVPAPEETVVLPRYWRGNCGERTSG